MAEEFMGLPTQDESEKISKPAVNYRQTEDQAQMCANCKNFRDPNRCELVAGEIDPADTCDLFEAAEESGVPAEGGGGDMMSALFGGGPGGGI